jgi:hypothetical protein
MSTARLTLKQPTGWFAAGREVAQALAVLSDGAFKLYIHLCLQADRHTARARIELTGLARVLRKSAASIEADLGELDCSGVCERWGDRIEIRDRFWPYHKQTGIVASNPQANFVQQAREAFLKRACVRSTFTAADEKLALNLYQRRVSLDQLRQAIWLGCARKYMAMLNGQTRVPITSLAYFATLIDEVSHSEVPASYWEYVRGRMEEWEKRWLQTRRSAQNTDAVHPQPSAAEMI